MNGKFREIQSLSRLVYLKKVKQGKNIQKIGMKLGRKELFGVLNSEIPSPFYQTQIDFGSWLS